MTKRITVGAAMLILLGAFIVLIYPKPFASKHERKVLYWTDPMIPGDRSDRPGKSPMGMDRTPVYADETVSSGQPQPDSTYYTCPMHPSVHSDKPGACPVCGMALVRKSAGVNPAKDDLAKLESVSLSPVQQVMANVTAVPVERKTLRKEIRAVGVIDFAEPGYLHISMRFPGRADKLYLTYTGQQVRKGDPVAEVYSPEAASAQQEYLLTLESYEQLKNAPPDVSSGSADLLLEAKKKLISWGFTDRQGRQPRTRGGRGPYRQSGFPSAAFKRDCTGLRLLCQGRRLGHENLDQSALGPPGGCAGRGLCRLEGLGAPPAS